MDKGQKKTKKEIRKIEKTLRKKYTATANELKNRVREKLAVFEIMDKENLAKVKAGTMSEEAYKTWRTKQLTATPNVRAMQKDIAERLTRVNVEAMNTVKTSIDDVYKVNVEAGIAEVATTVGASVDLINGMTVGHLVNPVSTVLPKVDIGKDLRWNNQRIKSALVQSVAKGESVPKIAKRISNITGQTGGASLRTARTAINSAHNGGRMEAFTKAVDAGIQIDKQWLATADNRVRKSHMLMDGETVGVREEFSNGLMFPQDPYGEPAEVYNCRCTMIAVPKNANSKVDVEQYDLEELANV